MQQLLASRRRPTGVPGPGRWLVDPARTRVTCSGRASRLAPMVRASFTAAAGQVCIGADAEDSCLEVTIDVGSLTTGTGAWDRALRAADPLSAGAFPLATYRSHSISWLQPGRAAVDGVLELAGGTQPVSLDVSYRRADDAVQLTAGGSILSRDRPRVPGLSYLVPRRFALDIEAVAVPA